ncbi:SPOR domain-containing protein [Elizabethkingia meningoseptica]|uniref:SPOR domain-containing protein n=1 Tax=Elizabethkingia meningoseptica TaxID=238 RepID=UPI00301E34BD
MKIYILFFTVFAQYFAAQEIINRKDSINGNVYSVEMDVRIDDLLRQIELNCLKPKIKKGDTKKSVYSKFLDKNKKESKIRFNTISMAEICKEKPKLMGYKIQIAVTNKGYEANKIRYEIRKKFPDLRTELDSSLRPNYKILAGSFFSKQSGSADLKRVRAIYPDAVLIVYRIFCAESK